MDALEEYPFQTLLQQILSEIFSSRDLLKFDSFSLFNLIWALKKINYSNAENLEKLITKATERGFEDYIDPACSTTFFIFTKFPNINLLDHGVLIQKIRAEIDRRNFITSEDVQTVCNVLSTLTKLQIFDETYYKRFIESLLPRDFRKFPPQSLCVIFHEFAEYGKIDTNLLEKICIEMKNRKLDKFNGQDLMMICGSLLKFRHRDEELLKLAVNKLILDEDRFSMKQFSNQSLVNLIWIFAKFLFYDYRFFNVVSKTILFNNQERLNLFTSHDVAQLIFGYASVGHADDTGLVDLIIERLLNPRKNQHFDVRHFSLNEGLPDCFWGFVKLEKITPELVKLFTEEISERRKIEGFDVLTLTRFLWCYSKIGFMDQKLLQSFLSEINSRNFSTFTSFDIAGIAWSLAKLSHYDAKFYENVSNLVSNEKNLSYFNFQDLSSLIYSFAISNFRDERTINNIVSELEKKIDEYNTSEKIQTLWSLACLDMLHSPQVLRFLNSETEIIQNKAKSHIEAIQLHQFRLAWFKQYPDCNDLPKLVQHFFQNDSKWIEENLDDNESTIFSSNQHLKVSALLIEMGYSGLQNEYRTKNDLFIDILLNEELKIGIEVDGPFHYLSNGMLNGSTLFKKRLLENDGYKIISIKVNEFKKLKKNDQIKWLTTEINKAMEDKKLTMLASTSKKEIDP